MHMRLSCDTMLTTTTTVASFAFLLPLRKVNISDFPYSRSVKLQQRLSTEKDEQQPPFVHRWVNGNAEISLPRILFSKISTPLGIITACVSDDNCCKLRKRTWTQWWSAVVKVMILLSPLNQWEISVSGSPSIFCGPHPAPSQIFHFALASGSLAIPSARSNRGLWTVCFNFAFF